MMDRNTGRFLDPAGDAYLVQSIGDVLTTPLATRPMLRAYGSTLPDEIDAPGNALGRMRLYAATALALQHWLPIVRLKAVRLAADALGAAVLRLTIARRDQPGRGVFDLIVPLPTA